MNYKKVKFTIEVEVEEGLDRSLKSRLQRFIEEKYVENQLDSLGKDRSQGKNARPLLTNVVI